MKSGADRKIFRTRSQKEIDNHAGRLIKIDCGAGSAVIDFDGTGHMERKEEHHNGY